MSDLEVQIRGHATEVARRRTPVSGAAIRAAARGLPSDDPRSTAGARRPRRRQRRLLLVMAAALAVVLATGVVIARRHPSSITVATPDAGSGDVLRVLPADGAHHVEVLTVESTGDYLDGFVGVDGRQYALAVNQPMSARAADSFFASLRSDGPTQDVEVNGVPGVQQLCNEPVQKTVNDTPVGPPVLTGRMTLYWQIDGRMVSLGVRATGANADCAPDGVTAKAIIAAADAVRVIPQERWDTLISAAATGSCPGYEPSSDAVLIIC
jgi:hypothetical protein